MTSKTDDVREAVARIATGGLIAERDLIHGGGFYVCHPIGMKREDQIFSDWDDACEHLGKLRADAILALINPAPAGVAGAKTDSAFRIASDLHAAYEQLIYGLPKYLEAKNLTDEENMIREAYITLDVTAHRLAALKEAAK